MSALALPRPILEASFQQFRDCGAGRAECVAYWCAALDEPDRLSRVVHPVHHAGLGGYEVDPAWVNGFFLALRSERQTARVQVHTHPFEAGHSSTDDQFALAPATGFVSLVIPDFAAGPVGLDQAAAFLMTASGAWEQVHPEEAFRVE